MLNKRGPETEACGTPNQRLSTYLTNRWPSPSAFCQRGSYAQNAMQIYLNYMHLILLLVTPDLDSQKQLLQVSIDVVVNAVYSFESHIRVETKNFRWMVAFDFALTVQRFSKPIVKQLLVERTEDVKRTIWSVLKQV